MELILDNVEIIVDNIKTYTNGNIHILDDKIGNINYHYKDNNIKIIDMHGLKIMPLPFNKLDIDTYSENKDLEEIILDNPQVIKVDKKTSFDLYKPKLLNYIFYKQPYTLLDIDGLSIETINFIIKNINKDKLILINDLKDLLKLKLNLNDLVAYTTINPYKLLGYTYQYGRILKGNDASFIILDHDLNIVLKLVRGKYE